MTNFLLSAKLPPVTKEFALHLQEVFRPVELKPGLDKDAIMWSGGQQEVVNFVLRHAVQSKPQVNPVEEKKDEQEVQEPVRKPSFFRRVINFIKGLFA